MDRAVKMDLLPDHPLWSALVPVALAAAAVGHRLWPRWQAHRHRHIVGLCAKLDELGEKLVSHMADESALRAADLRDRGIRQGQMDARLQGIDARMSDGAREIGRLAGAVEVLVTRSNGGP